MVRYFRDFIYLMFNSDNGVHKLAVRKKEKNLIRRYYLKVLFSNFFSYKYLLLESTLRNWRIMEESYLPAVVNRFELTLAPILQSRDAVCFSIYIFSLYYFQKNSDQFWPELLSADSRKLSSIPPLIC